MHAETEAFVRGLFGRCRQPAFVTLTAIHPDGNHPTPSQHVPLSDDKLFAQALDKLLAANHVGWGAYIGIAPRKTNLGRWSRGGKYDLFELPALFVDVDDPQDALGRLIDFHLPPSCIVSSGRGYHAYWYLREPTQDFRTADNLLKGLARQFDADDNMTTAQSMRIAGTCNTKPNRDNAPCHLVEFHPQRLYDLAAFTTYIQPKREISKVHDRCPMKSRVLDTRTFQEFTQMMSQLLIRNFDGYEKRNGWIASLCPCGHTKDHVGSHFNFHPKRGVAYCFGKHGRIALNDLWDLIQSVPTCPDHMT